MHWHRCLLVTGIRMSQCPKDNDARPGFSEFLRASHVQPMPIEDKEITVWDPMFLHLPIYLIDSLLNADFSKFYLMCFWFPRNDTTSHVCLWCRMEYQKTTFYPPSPNVGLLHVLFQVGHNATLFLDNHRTYFDWKKSGLAISFLFSSLSLRALVELGEMVGTLNPL